MSVGGGITFAEFCLLLFPVRERLTRAMHACSPMHVFFVQVLYLFYVLSIKPRPIFEYVVYCTASKYVYFASIHFVKEFLSFIKSIHWCERYLCSPSPYNLVLYFNMDSWCRHTSPRVFGFFNGFFFSSAHISKACRIWKAHLVWGILPTAVPRPGHNTLVIWFWAFFAESLCSFTVKNKNIYVTGKKRLSWQWW